MDNKTIFTKTAKGVGEAVGKTRALSRDLRTVLKEVDGKASLDELLGKISTLSEAKIHAALSKLSNEDYIREFIPASLEADTLDFSTILPLPAKTPRQPSQKTLINQALAKQLEARAKAEVEAFERMQREQQERERQAEEDHARRKAEEKEKRAEQQRAMKAAQESARLEAEERARQAKEEESRQKAEQLARREAEQAARREAELKARQEAEARKRLAAEERAKRDAEEKARREAEELATKNAEAQRLAEEQARVAAVEKERRKAEEQAKQEAEEAARRDAEPKARWAAGEEAKRRLEEMRRQQAEAEARQAKEDQARLEAEELARKAEEEARRAAEERERQAAAEQARLEAEAKARQEAEAESRRRAEEQARREAELKARQEAEEQKRLEAEERAKRESEERAKHEAEEKARREAEILAIETAEAEARRLAEERARVEAEEARRKEEERARQEAEEAARREAEELARREKKAQAEKEAEELRRRQEELKARQEAEERKRVAAEEQAKRAAEEHAKREAEEKARREAEELARQNAEAEAQRIADEEVQREFEELARLQAEDVARQKAEVARRQMEEVAQRKAEAKAKKEKEDRARQEREKAEARREAEIKAKQEIEQWQREADEERARRSANDAPVPETKKRSEPEFADSTERSEDTHTEQYDQPEYEQDAYEAEEQGREKKFFFAKREKTYRKPIKWGKPLSATLFLSALIGLGLIHVMEFDGQRALFEKSAAAQFQQPVKIGSLHLSLLPKPHWRLEDVAIGTESQLSASQVRAMTSLTSLFDDKVTFSSIELHSPVFKEQALEWLLYSRPQQRSFRVDRISVFNARLASENITLPPFDASGNIGMSGSWTGITIDFMGKDAYLRLQPDGDAVQLELNAASFGVPFGSTLTLDGFTAKGKANRKELVISEFTGGVYGGIVGGTAKLQWGPTWSLKGDIHAKLIDAPQFAPDLLQSGKLEGNANFSLQSKHADTLFEAPRMEGQFAIQNGTLLGVDFARLLRSSNSAGKSSFAELTGAFVHENGKTQLQKMYVGAGLLSVKGNADMDTDRNLNGRFTVELKSPTQQARSSLVVDGTLKAPRFNR